MQDDAPELTDGVVLLRPLALDDVDAYLDGEDDELARWLHGGLRDRENVEDHVRRAMFDWLRGGPVFSFAIREADGDRLAGTLDVHPDHPDLAQGQADLSYGLLASARGRGYATRAVRLGCAFVAARAGIREAVITVDPRNAASVEVAQRCGFRWSRRLPAVAGGFDRYVRNLDHVLDHVLDLRELRDGRDLRDRGTGGRSGSRP